MTSGDDELLPPGPCRALHLVCEECPLALCLEDLREPTDVGRKKGNVLLARWCGAWPMAKVIHTGRAGFVALTNHWLRGTVLPEARRVIEGKSNALGRQQAKTIVAMLGT
jgi:hypothetical protein